jgi:hypothetical protein|tara:strand:+ start:473 stop:655 length:183 start_codon:yes stop_codon:yes gene_type:complete
MYSPEHYWERLEKKLDKFLLNDFRHMAEDVASLKAQVRIIFSLLLIILAAAVGILARGIF